jgi:hypothetical protein
MVVRLVLELLRQMSSPLECVMADEEIIELVNH